MNILYIIFKLIQYLFIPLLAAFLYFIYTAQKDYDEREKSEGHKPRLENKSSSIKYDPAFPLFDPNPKGDVFLSLVFPAYNEEKRLAPALSKSINFFKTKPFKYEIIIVNDGSKDKTYDLIKSQMKLYPEVDIIGVTYDKNGGKGYAVRTGMKFARGKYILMLDSDGATDIKDYDRLYEEIKDKDFALAIGSRKIISEKANRVWYRNIMGTVNNLIVRQMIGVGDIKDTQCGFKLFTKSAAQVIFKNLHLVRWAFDVEMLYIARKTGISVKEVAVNWQEIDGSKLVVVTATISFFRDYFAMIVFYNTGYWKIANDFVNAKKN